jgi:hypothetical protein
VTLSAPSFVTLSNEEERQAIDALAELLVPLLVERTVQTANLEPLPTKERDDA